MMKKITYFLVASFMFLGAATFAQGTISGTVTDAGLGGPLSGANVIEDGTTNGAISDFDGNFSLNVSSNSGTVTISFVGYTSKSVSFTLSNGSANLGTITLMVDADSLEEVVIIGSGVIDMAADRKTPVAVSTITANEIQSKVIGNVEITESIKSTPSAFISGDTGFGDSQLFLRGFDQTNIGVLLNGQPVNGMEDGRVYWSNWAGIADVANAVQVQRGLGSSKLAISSVGGTMNIVMKTTERDKGGFVRFLGANDSYFKGTAAYDSGMNDSGWAFSVLVDYWQAHRKWSKGTFGAGQNYFFSVGYKPNDSHSLNFLVTGAPQMHGQKWSQSKENIEYDPKYNQHWGYTGGDWSFQRDGIESERTNFYHKPIMNLNWDWDISEDTGLSSVLYASWGRGGGTGDRGDGRLRTEGDGPLRGQLDYPGIITQNLGDPDGIGNSGDYFILDDGEEEGNYIRRASMNNHQWYGLVTNLSHDFSDRLSANIGADVRMYTGDHFRQVTDFYGLEGWANDRGDDLVVYESYDINPWKTLFNFAEEDERIAYDYSEDINYAGGFGQLEYSDGKFSIFAQGSYSTQSYEREGRMWDEGNSEKVTKEGYNIKGGLSYTIAEKNTIFLNGGYYSRQPYLDNIFTNIRYSNDLVNPEVDNEIIRSMEAGYHLRCEDFSASFNAYVTDWDNRTTVSTGEIDPDPEVEGDEINVNELQRGIRQYHTGAEVEFKYRPTSWVKLQGYISAGSWVYKGESSVDIYNDETGELLDSETGINREGIKVSTAPQFSTGLGATFYVVQGLSVDGTINYRSNHYEFTSVSTSAVGYDPSQLKPFSLTDLGLTYNFQVSGQDLTFRANCYNVFDEVRINQTDAFGYFTTNGRTFNGSLRYNF
jgi:hypothetical protein